MLTQRQRRLLTLLMAAGDWQTSEELAERLMVSSKLVKQEISQVRRTAGDACAIQSSTGRGYRLARISNELRAELAHEFDVHEGHHSITRRYARMFVYLLFQDEPVSMAQMARAFFCSKAAIADEVEVLRYRLKRLPNLTLTVDAHRGLAIAGQEGERWYEASKWLQDSFAAELPLAGDGAERLVATLECTGSAARTVLGGLARAGRISGDDVARVGRFLAIALERIRLGHHAPEVPARHHASTRVQELAARLLAALDDAPDASSDAGGLMMLEQLLEDCIVPEDPAPSAHAHAHALAGLVGTVLGPRAERAVLTREQPIAQFLDQALGRMERGHGALNYHASRTMAAYPLEAYLALRFISQLGAFPTAKAEAAQLALVLADALAPLRPRASAIIYSNESLSAVRHITALVRALYADVFSSVTALPALTARDADAQDAFVFTTDPSCLMPGGAGAVLSSLPNVEEVAQLRGAVEAWRTGRLERVARVVCAPRPRALEEAALQDMLSGCEDACSGVGAWEGFGGAEAVALTCYRTVVLVRAAPCAAVPESALWETTLAQGVRYRGKRYDRLIECAFDGRGNIFDVFDVLAHAIAHRERV